MDTRVRACKFCSKPVCVVCARLSQMAGIAATERTRERKIGGREGGLMMDGWSGAGESFISNK